MWSAPMPAFGGSTPEPRGSEWACAPRTLRARHDPVLHNQFWQGRVVVVKEQIET